jgi:hypothetical protein
MKPRFKVEHVEAALRKSHGLVSLAAELLAKAYGSCSPGTVRNYLKRHPKLQAVVEETIERTLDLAENRLIRAIGDGNMTGVIFYLKTKGKGRGYVERLEASGPGGGPIQTESTHNVILPDNGRDDPLEDWRS